MIGQKNWLKALAHFTPPPQQHFCLRTGTKMNHQNIYMVVVKIGLFTENFKLTHKILICHFWLLSFYATFGNSLGDKRSHKKPASTDDRLPCENPLLISSLFVEFYEISPNLSIYILATNFTFTLDCTFGLYPSWYHLRNLLPILFFAVW